MSSTSRHHEPSSFSRDENICGQEAITEIKWWQAALRNMWSSDPFMNLVTDGCVEMAGGGQRKILGWG